MNIKLITGCPYDEFIIDEDSGVKVKNDRYTDWMEGYNRGYEQGREDREPSKPLGF